MKRGAYLRRTGPNTAAIEYYRTEEKPVAAVLLEAETPPLDLSKIPAGLKAGIAVTESREVVAFESQPPAAPAVGVAEAEERPAPESETVTITEIIDLNAPNCPIVIVPTDWIKGQLLNVRNNGADYVITLLGEEFDPRHPERALLFANPVECQNFVSRWYARENHDARAY